MTKLPSHQRRVLPMSGRIYKASSRPLQPVADVECQPQAYSFKWLKNFCGLPIKTNARASIHNYWPMQLHSRHYLDNLPLRIMMKRFL